MILGGNATLFVADFEASLRFYTEVLGLTLRFRADNHWAEVVAGNELVIGLHPAKPNHAAPGTRGAVEIGLVVNEPLEDVRAHLEPQGVTFTGDIIEDENAALRFLYLQDPDGNILYLWEQPAAPTPETSVSTGSAEA